MVQDKERLNGTCLCLYAAEGLSTWTETCAKFLTTLMAELYDARLKGCRLGITPCSAWSSYR